MVPMATCACCRPKTRSCKSCRGTLLMRWPCVTCTPRQASLCSACVVRGPAGMPGDTQSDSFWLGRAGHPWAACPRSALKRVLAKAERVHGITFNVGYESEFILLQRPATPKDEVPPAIDRAIYALSAAYDAASDGEAPGHGLALLALPQRLGGLLLNARIGRTGMYPVWGTACSHGRDSGCHRGPGRHGRAAACGVGVWPDGGRDTLQRCAEGRHSRNALSMLVLPSQTTLVQSLSSAAPVMAQRCLPALLPCHHMQGGCHPQRTCAHGA